MCLFPDGARCGVSHGGAQVRDVVLPVRLMRTLPIRHVSLRTRFHGRFVCDVWSSVYHPPAGSIRRDCDWK